MYFCNTGLECRDCVGGCNAQLEKKCDCGEWILWSEEACPKCLKKLNSLIA